jgi:hypothetical protein
MIRVERWVRRMGRGLGPGLGLGWASGLGWLVGHLEALHALGGLLGRLAALATFALAAITMHEPHPPVRVGLRGIVGGGRRGHLIVHVAVVDSLACVRLVPLHGSVMVRMVRPVSIAPMVVVSMALVAVAAICPV